MNTTLDSNVYNNLSEWDIIFIRRVAARIHRSGLVTPAIFFLELTKPLALIGSHGMIFFGPIINAFINTEGYYKAAELFEEPANVELLIREIEKLEDDLTHA
ncbi:MAG TPA: hypothetical protein EYM74_03405 [Candidatus Marinimicrobia bacterium]|nr:hypothetical protein [Candidatus Neomarinimicrobiota bacterium]